MPSPSKRRSLLTQRVLDLIGEEWVSADDLMDRAIPLVPPGKALRDYRIQTARNAAERQRRIASGKKVGPTPPPPSEREAIRIGARNIINGILSSNRETRVLDMEARANRFDRWVRLSPERLYSHHCCLHGGSCAKRDPEPAPEEPDEELELVVVAPPSEEGMTLVEWLEHQGIATVSQAQGQAVQTILDEVPRETWAGLGATRPPRGD